MANTNYKRHDKDNNEVDMTGKYDYGMAFQGNEGWSTLNWLDWNNAYQARNVDNTARTPGTYQARNTDNTTRTPAAYQRHDVNNNPVSA